MRVLKNVGAVVAGWFLGSMANMAVVTVSQMIWTVPEGMDLNVPEQFAAYIAGLPTGAFVFAMVAHILQAVLGAFIAARLAASRPVLLAVIIGVLTAAASAWMLQMMGGPAWMWVEVPLEVGLAYGVGAWVASRRPDT